MDKVLIAPATLAGVQAEFLNVLKKAGFELVFPNKKGQMLEHELLEQLTGAQGRARRVGAVHEKSLTSASAVARDRAGGGRV